MTVTRLNLHKTESAVAKGARQIIERAVKTGVSDIHVEPSDSYLLVRYRRAGSLYLANKIPNTNALPLIKHLKSLAELETDSANKPQSGNAALKVGRQEYRLTISTLPLIKGEKVTIHVHPTNLTADSLESMGIWGPTKKLVERSLGISRGLVLVTGRNPESIGLTIVSLLSRYESLPVKVAMIGENALTPKSSTPPVLSTQVKLGVNRQISLLVNEGINMLGVNPIVDYQTASAVLSAINRGLLVFGGVLSANLAQGLVDAQYLIKEPLGLIPEVICLYQVEVRGLCPHCREKYALNTADQQILNKLFDTSKSSKVKQFHELEKEAAKDNIEAGLPLTSSPGQINQLWRAHSRGCKRCDYTGYVQSVRLFEACRLTNDIKRHLLGAGSVSEIYKSALEDGMINLLSDGLVKALRGQIDLPALMSVATLQ